jgi:hypothetical protein
MIVVAGVCHVQEKGRTEEEKEMGGGPTGAKSYFPYMGPRWQTMKLLSFN